ncbi:hypothetical protein DFH09DRAFT_224129 [Mycena vulgaris]|nr:hypothetical protein DFH09DRAFT_224129 [Mycena vulgaris]
MGVGVEGEEAPTHRATRARATRLPRRSLRPRRLSTPRARRLLPITSPARARAPSLRLPMPTPPPLPTPQRSNRLQAPPQSKASPRLARCLCGRRIARTSGRAGRVRMRSGAFLVSLPSLMRRFWRKIGTDDVLAFFLDFPFVSTFWDGAYVIGFDRTPTLAPSPAWLTPPWHSIRFDGRTTSTLADFLFQPNRHVILSVFPASCKSIQSTTGDCAVRLRNLDW